MKAEELIRDALQELGVQAAEQPITPDQVQTGIRYANDMMEEYDYLNLGYSIIDSASDEITVPGFARTWMKKQLALHLAPQFTATSMVPMISQQASRALDNLLMQSLEIGEMSMPATLPVGSGNELWDSRSRTFYPDGEEIINTEDGQNILTEDN